MLISIRVMEGGYTVRRTDGVRRTVEDWVCPTTEDVLVKVKELLTDMPACMVDAVMELQPEREPDEATSG